MSETAGAIALRLFCDCFVSERDSGQFLEHRMFSDAARGDDTLSIIELHKMLAEKLAFTEADIAAVKIDHSGDSVVDEYEFVSPHRLHIEIDSCILCQRSCSLRSIRLLGTKLG